jgi:hypothetical protein
LRKQPYLNLHICKCANLQIMALRNLLLLFSLLQVVIAFLTDGQSFTHEEAMWHYIGRNWFGLGLTPYAGGVDNKSPLIFAVFGLSDLLFGLNYWFPRILGIGCQTAGIYFLYKIALQLYTREAAVITATLYGLSLLWHATGGKYVSFTETYAVTFILIAVYYYVTGSRKRYFLSGLMAGIATAWRLSASFGATAILIHALAKKRNALVPFIGGLLTGIAALVLLFIAAGIDINELYLHAFAGNFGSGSTTDHSFAWKLENFVNNFFYSELILFYPAVAAYFLLQKKYSLLTLWLIVEFIGINVLGIYAYPHFKQLLPALSLISGISIAQLVHVYGVPFRGVLTVIWIVFFPKVTEPLYALKKLFVPPPDRSAELCAPPFARTEERSEEKLGSWIRANTKPNDHVLVAGYGARVQLYANRLSPTIYFNVTQTPRAKARLMHEVIADKPEMIAVPVFPDYKVHVSEDLREFVDTLVYREYLFERCLYGYNVYRKISNHK